MLESEFSNKTVDVTHSPQLKKLELIPLSEKYAATNLKINAVVTLILLAIGLTIYFQPFIDLPIKFSQVLPFIILALFFINILYMVINLFADKLKRYALRELDLHFYSGIFFRKIVSQPITRIQHIELKRGPIDRKIGLATLQVFSAGGAAHTFEIPGLPLEKAQELRQFILEHKDVVKHG